MASPWLSQVIAETLEFHYFDGAVTALKPGHRTLWRSMPLTVVSQFVRGCGEIELENGSTRTVPCGAALLAPDLTHRVRLLSGVTAAARWAHLEFRVLSTVDVLSLFHVPIVVHGRTARQLGDICEALSTLQRDNGLDFSVLARQKQLGFQLLGEIIAEAPYRPKTVQFLERTSRLAPALSHIEEHLTEPTKPEDLARTVNLSIPHFYAVFKGAMGMAPLAYLRRRRLDRARLLLATSDRNVGEVAYAVGFCDPYHFSKQFKGAFGVSPSEYKSARSDSFDHTG